uniref:Adenosine monophosphate-protein transferase n=1 Tax=candidate division WOR-3 bacterium TaxID=2052148 RepID=A0A7C4U750_UNCW3
MEIKIVHIEKPENANVIIGQSHFIKTVEDLSEILITTVPGIKFGVGFCESSGKRLVRHTGNDKEFEELASKNAFSIGAGHSFIIIMRNAYPINVLKKIKDCDEVCSIFCATANPVDVIVIEEGDKRGIIGVLDGGKPLGIECEDDIKERKEFLRKIGYKE